MFLKQSIAQVIVFSEDKVNLNVENTKFLLIEELGFPDKEETKGKGQNRKLSK